MIREVKIFILDIKYFCKIFCPFVNLKYLPIYIFLIYFLALLRIFINNSQKFGKSPENFRFLLNAKLKISENSNLEENEIQFQC